MSFDAFTGGIDPGGLRTKNEIRILICYLLTSIETPLAKDDLIGIIGENGLANYFEVTDAIAEMAEKGIIVLGGKDSGLCSATDTARMISKQLDSELPSTVRRKALCAAINLLARAKRERENKVEIVPAEKGYRVTCHISGGSTDLMDFSLYMPDLAQANIVKENFHRSPETVYRMLLALVTGNRDIAEGIFKGSGS
ncbi:MAG: DUF4364 family protein [Oscillospiraceae bacterium]|nr:DUF4364 family protein [Oscillospiraceae bacterium]MCI1990452.1 DUF4364 family protein [Oscillospiraceae bacterium]MCI2035790.1 DUF4364 family protein [Oscillospiraceae bacterium]